MFWQGIPWSHALGGAAVCGIAVAALFFLRVRYPDLPVPSVMLWRAAQPESRRTVLWKKLEYPLHLLCLLLAVLAVAGALAQPVWRYREVAPVAVVAEPSALKDAEKTAAVLDPGRTVLIAAGAAPETVRDFQVSAGARESTVPQDGLSNRSDALLLARKLTAPANGRIVFFGATPPPWLPENGFWVRSGIPAKQAAAPAWRIYFSGVPRPASLPSGVTAADPPEGADLIVDDLKEWGTPNGWSSFFHELRPLRGLYTDGRQQESISATAAEAVSGENGCIRFSNVLWLLAFLLLAADLWFWNRGKLV